MPVDASCSSNRISLPARLYALMCICGAMFFLAGCEVSPGEEENGTFAIYGNGHRIDSSHHNPNTTDGTDFGEALAGDDGDSVVRTFVARNTTPYDIAFAAASPRVRLAGGDEDDFAIVQDLPDILPANSEASFRVVFAPILVEERTTVISIPYLLNQVEEEFTAQILGTGISRGRLQVAGEDGATISHNSTIFSQERGTDFGAVVNDGSEMSVSTFALHNTAESGVLEITDVRITGENAADFKVFLQPDSPIAHGDHKPLSLQFSPEEGVTGQRFARVEVRSSYALISPYMWFIRGTAIAPEDEEAPAADF
ncbi:MAG: choice-of-anchor D domain-containing protein [Planctomycetota bacterium]|nr:MAG: choice-of-anchor D domain-containing protein [Planctomycetota bacterium]